MINLQVNHSEHTPLHSYIIKNNIPDTINSIQTQSLQKHECKKSPQENSRNATATTKISDKQSEVISNIKATNSKLKQDLQELINDYKDSAEKMMINHGYDPERETAIRQHLARLHKEKQQRRSKFERDLAKLQAKKIALQQLPQKNSQEKEERRKSIEERIQKIQQRQHRRREQQARFIKFYEDYKSQKPKYKIMEENFNKKEQEQKQSKLNSLKQKVEQTYRPMNLQQLQSFQQEYEKNRYQAQKMRLQNKLMQKKRIEANEAKLHQLYKGHSHTTVLKELQERQSKTDQPREKIKRIKEYSEIVREEYRPRVMSSCDDTIDQSQSSQMPQTQRGKRVLKERFLHGQYLGKKVEFEKTPLSHSEQITKGMEYLQYLKKLPKKPKQKTEAQVSVPQEKRTIASVYRVARNRNPLYQGRRYNSIDFNSQQLKNGEGVRRMLQVMRHQKGSMELQQRVIKNQSYENREEFMRAQNRYNNNIYSGIKQKLAILSQL